MITEEDANICDNQISSQKRARLNEIVGKVRELLKKEEGEENVAQKWNELTRFYQNL